MPWAFLNEERREKKRAGNQRWRKRHHDYDLNRQAKYRENNRERERLRAIEYRRSNPANSRAIRLRYEKRHPIAGKTRCARRRAKLAGASIKDQAILKKWEAEWRKKRKVKCYWCENFFPPKECHTDHAVALVKGGEHSVGNAVISCSTCNHKKHSKSIKEWNNKLTSPVLF